MSRTAEVLDFFQRRVVPVLLRYRFAVISVFLAATVALSLWCSFLLRFDYEIPDEQQRFLLLGLALAIPVKMVCFYVGRLHRGWFGITSISDLLRIAFTSSSASAIFAFCAVFCIGRGFPRSIYLLDAALTLLFLSATRVVIRLVREALRLSAAVPNQKIALIWGEQWAAAALARDLQNTPDLGYHVIGFLDDNARQKGEYVMDLPVYGASSPVQSLNGLTGRGGELTRSCWRILQPVLRICARPL